MFAKIFDSIYEGTLGEHWQALVTFQQMLILCTADGVLDKTPSYISRTTGIPLEIITAGVAFLELPDPRSRSRAMEGRRIVRLDESRDWGWFIVNHEDYRRRISREEKREADRTRIAGIRAQARQSKLFDGHLTGDSTRQPATSGDTSQSVADVAHNRVQSTDRASQEEKTSCSAISRNARERTREAVEDSPVAATLPLNDGSDYPITEAQVREFSDLYPAVDVRQALRAMRGWCVTNPTNRKTRAGVLRFVNRWLAKEQDSARPANGGGHDPSQQGGAGRRLSAAERVAAVNAAAEQRRRNERDIEGDFVVR
jgi:hypothetical protein